MKSLLTSARPLLSDLLATLTFAVVAALTHNPLLATALAIAVGVVQVVVMRLRGQSIAPLQWTSLALVIVFGGATLLTHDARFMMLKPTLVYAVVGAAMLKRGWMLRYLPPKAASAGVEPLFVGWGYAWAGLMFLTGGLNFVMARSGDITAWAGFIAVFPPASKAALFGAQYLHVRRAVVRRLRAAQPPAEVVS